MLATRITTHVADALARMMQEYKVIPTQYNLPLVSAGGDTVEVSAMGALVAVQADQIQLLENAIFALDARRQFFNGTTFPSVGAQLDGIGEIVGIGRNGLTDAEYLIFLLGTIAENNSDTTIPTMMTIASLLFQTTELRAYEMFPAEFDFQIPVSSPLQSFLYPLVASILHNSLGAGISLGFISLYTGNPFRFSKVGGPQLGGGFGSAFISDGVLSLPMDNYTHFFNVGEFTALAVDGPSVQTGLNITTADYNTGQTFYISNPVVGKNVLLDGAGFIGSLVGGNNYIVTVTDNSNPNGLSFAITSAPFPTPGTGGGFAKNIFNNPGA